MALHILLNIVAFIVQHTSAQAGPQGPSSAFLRFGCSQLVIERTDPLVSPGQNPSPHMHQIVGGDSFNVSMDPRTIDPPKQSSCTSCIYTEDTSNYWTASIYFQSPENGTFKRVPQMANGRINNTLLEQDGGLTVYYMKPFGGTNMNTTAMTKGFRMLAGDPMNRDKNKVPPGICHRCLTEEEKKNPGVVSGAPCDAHDFQSFPPTPCPGGIRATVIFPSCWDGVNLDSPNHQSHVAYDPSGNVLAGDKCPSTHPIRIPQVMYEIMYDTAQFNDPDYWTNGTQPLVYSFGDASGYGQHGDYLFGWKDDFLQRGMDALGHGCTSEDCTNTFTVQDGRDAIACTKEQQAKEDTGTDTWLMELPGGATITYAAEE